MPVVPAGPCVVVEVADGLAQLLLLLGISLESKRFEHAVKLLPTLEDTVHLATIPTRTPSIHNDANSVHEVIVPQTTVYELAQLREVGSSALLYDCTISIHA